MKIETHRLAEHTTYGIGGLATVHFPENLAELQQCYQVATAEGRRVFILGRGSNTLASDSGIDALIVSSRWLNGDLSVAHGEDGVRIRTGCGVSAVRLCRFAAEQGLSGLEFLAGIPGNVGGVVAMNAGTVLGDAGHALAVVEYFDPARGELGRISGAGLRFSYRKNLCVPPGAAVWSAEWRVSPAKPEDVKKTIVTAMQKRKQSQPVELRSCGSVFKNLPSRRAADVLDELGLRSYRLGDAQFSTKHPNFIVNLGNARASDVWSLIKLAKTRAAEQLQLELETEVVCVGAFD
jgi:UDP-N-acetylmuramate dehydrogenase